MSDIENIVLQPVKIRLFGQDYNLQFNNRVYAAIQAKFGKNPLEIVSGMFSCDPTTAVICLWGGSLVFEEFNEADPLKIKEEIPLEKLYMIDFLQIWKPLREAILASQPEQDDEVVEVGKKQTEAPPVEGTSSKSVIGLGRYIWRRLFCR